MWELHSVPEANMTDGPVAVVLVRATVLEDDTTQPFRDRIESRLESAAILAHEREQFNLQAKEEHRPEPSLPEGDALLALEQARFETRNPGLTYAPGAFQAIVALAEGAMRRSLEMQGALPEEALAEMRG